MARPTNTNTQANKAVIIGDKTNGQSGRKIFFNKPGKQSGSIVEVNRILSKPKEGKEPLEGYEVVIELANGTEKIESIFDANQFGIIEQKIESQQLDITLTYSKREGSVYLDLTIS
jgi:hypothetical protein